MTPHEQHESKGHATEDRELRALFQTQRVADVQRAPSFAQTSRAMPYRDRLGYLRAIMVAAVVVVMVVVIAVNALRRKDEAPPQVPVAQTPASVHEQAPALTASVPTSTSPPHAASHRPKLVPSISEWKSPTDALLQTPGDELRTKLPKIGTTSTYPSLNE